MQNEATVTRDGDTITITIDLGDGASSAMHFTREEAKRVAAAIVAEAC
jgi:hypothetical protein